MCGVCDKCMKLCSIIFLVVGILFLLQDLVIWDFWNISWYTALFLLVGIGGLCSVSCPECKAVHKGK